jgi:hypothetical protein
MNKHAKLKFKNYQANELENLLPAIRKITKSVGFK